MNGFLLSFLLALSISFTCTKNLKMTGAAEYSNTNAKSVDKVKFNER